MSNKPKKKHQLKQILSGKLRFFVLIGVLILVGVLSILAYSSDDNINESYENGHGYYEGHSVFDGENGDLPGYLDVEDDEYFYTYYYAEYCEGGTVPIMPLSFPIFVPNPGHIALTVALHGLPNPRPGGIYREYPIIPGSPLDITIPVHPGYILHTWAATLSNPMGITTGTLLNNVSIPLMDASTRPIGYHQHTGQVTLPPNTNFGYIMASFIRVTVQYRKRDLNIDTNDAPRRAVVGYAPSDFSLNAYIRSLMPLPTMHIDRLRLELPQNDDFNFGEGVYTELTDRIPNLQVSYDIPIFPRKHLPAGLHTTEVRVYQDVFPGSNLDTTYPPPIETWDGRSLADQTWFGGTFEVIFFVERPVIHIDFTNQNTSNITVDATLNVRDVWDICDDNPDGILEARDLPVTPGITYTYLDQSNPQTSHIAITVQPPTVYTFFDGPGYCYQDIDIDPPYGYEEVSRRMDGDDLVVVFRPREIPTPTPTPPPTNRRFSFEFFKTCIAIQYNPLDRSPLEGAVFIFEWQVNGVWFSYETDPSDINGLVRVGYNEHIYLPINSIIRFYIHEEKAPDGFGLPDGHWYADFCTNSMDWIGPDPFRNYNYWDPIWMRIPFTPGASSLQAYADYEDYYSAQTQGVIDSAPVPHVIEDVFWHIGNREWVEPPRRYTITFFLNGADDPNYGEPFAIVRENREPGYPIGVGHTSPYWADVHPQYGAPYLDPVLPPHLAQAPLRFYGWVEVDEDGNRLDPNGRPLTRNDFYENYSHYGLYVDGDRYFKAVFGLWFDFIKTDMYIYEEFPIINPLEGAVFEIRWFNPDLNDYEVLYISQRSSHAACGTPGRVIIGDIHHEYHQPGASTPYAPYSPWLEHSLTDTSFDRFRDFRLFETVPPEPDGYFVLPPFGSFWIFYFCDINDMKLIIRPDFYEEQEVVGHIPPFRVINEIRHVGNRPFAIVLTKATRYPFHYYENGNLWDWKPLEDAMFVLERQGWPPGQWDYVLTVESDEDGMIKIQYPIPADSNGEFRIREVIAPDGYVLPPPGAWIIVTNQYREIVSLTFSDDNGSPIFDSYDGIFDYEIGWVFPNFPIREWPIFKIDWIIHTDDFYTRTEDNYLMGAWFRLYVYNGPSQPGPPMDMLVTSDMVGPAIDGFMWSYVTTQVSQRCAFTDDIVPMMFPMMPGRHYQLVEITPPVGFMLPFGQWRIEPGAVSPFPEGKYLVITEIDHAPPVRQEYRPESIGGAEHPHPHVYIGNRPILELPMAGGGGANIFYIAAFALLGGAMGILFGVTILRKRKARRLSAGINKSYV